MTSKGQLINGFLQTITDKCQRIKTVNLSSWFFAAAMANLRPQNVPLSAIYSKFHYFS